MHRTCRELPHVGSVQPLKSRYLFLTSGVMWCFGSSGSSMVPVLLLDYRDLYTCSVQIGALQTSPHAASSCSCSCQRRAPSEATSALSPSVFTRKKLWFHLALSRERRRGAAGGTETPDPSSSPQVYPQIYITAELKRLLESSTLWVSNDWGWKYVFIHLSVRKYEYKFYFCLSLTDDDVITDISPGSFKCHLLLLFSSSSFTLIKT